jgi:hypothetical protein
MSAWRPIRSKATKKARTKYGSLFGSTIRETDNRTVLLIPETRIAPSRYT